MNRDPYDEMVDLRNMAEDFDGDKRLFWAGRMSQCIGALQSCPLLSGNFPFYAKLAELCKKEYDDLILAEV